MVVAKWHVRRTSGAPKALAVALSFCRLLGLGCPKQAFAKIATPRLSLPAKERNFDSSLNKNSILLESLAQTVYHPWAIGYPEHPVSRKYHRIYLYECMPVESLLIIKNKMLCRQFKHFLKITAFIKHDDKKLESDQQMLLRVCIKFLTLIFFILVFDSLLDLFLSLLDIVIHLTHLMIEAIEYLLVLFLQFSINTTSQQSETIIVNTAIITALFLAYRLILVAPRLSIRFKRNLRAAWLRHIRREACCWRAMSIGHKIKCVSAYSFGTAFLLLFIG
ncbi:hypothetical protein BMR07_14455 [Methylococcaceae bacterium CS1]|nr:hypothetical protein BMR07_14455 [Methylococcaceae bacterium CS1]TXL08161.1 hypothetical protein BMR09_03910 [Methylococcaceae bacterium CS3]